MSGTASMFIVRPAEAVLVPTESGMQPLDATARLAYPYRYHGDADPHLSGQPCSLLANRGMSTRVDSYDVAFACGCRNVVPLSTLSRNSF